MDDSDTPTEARGLPRTLPRVRRCSHCPGGVCPCRRVTFTLSKGYTYGSEVRIYCEGEPTSAVYLGGHGWHCLRCGDPVAVVL